MNTTLIKDLETEIKSHADKEELTKDIEVRNIDYDSNRKDANNYNNESDESFIKCKNKNNLIEEVMQINHDDAMLLSHLEKT